jgi:Ca2+-transporting ATPase
MLAAIVVVSEFLYQDNRSRIAMESLEKLNEPLSTVLRNGEPIRIATANCNRRSSNCRGGNTINADGEIVHMISPLMNLTDRRTVCCFQIRKQKSSPYFSGTLHLA